VRAGSDELDAVIGALHMGDVVAIPTDTVYGLAVDPSRHEATDKLFDLKGRPHASALPVLVGDPAGALSLGMLDERAALIVAQYWPGALTIVVRRQPGVAFDLGGDSSTIGLRCPAHATVRRLLTTAGPLAVTSANRHTGAPCLSADDVRRVFGTSVVVLDGGRTGGRPSTVVSLVGAGVECLREGAVPMHEIAALWTADAAG
jgi:tRNA threonylcarbamoyl adenosine modification protein (Sua5/YciO/YrdC/YwlC family)